MNYHVPVLLNETVHMLRVRPDGRYIDGTAGGGGHAAAVARLLNGDALLAVDRDADAVAAASEALKDYPCAAVVKGDFHDIKAIAKAHGFDSADGVLLDLGVSSHQLDDAGRGFSYHMDAPLDMRMDQDASLTAAAICNTWSEADIAAILRDYGEERWAARIARVLCDRRPVYTTHDLVNIIDAAIPKKFRLKDDGHPARRTFQALRIAVNDELKPLNAALCDSMDILKPGGRLCVITFHSLEDRIVKRAFQTFEHPCVCPRDAPICVCGGKKVARVVGKPLRASADELQANPRARSATLRTAEKV